MPDGALLSEDKWVDLLVSIEKREVIPVVGCGVITVAETGEKLTAWLGKKLAAELKVPEDRIPPPGEVSDVIGAWYRGHRPPDAEELTYEQILLRIRTIIYGNRFSPAQHLVDLARIKHFDLFLTTSYDLTLQSALEQVRERETPASKIKRIEIWNTNNKPERDLPENWNDSGTILAYLLGSCGARGGPPLGSSPLYAASDAVIIDHVLDLSAAIKGKTLRNLATVLREKQLLLLGMNFDDWLTRFFIHVARTDNEQPWFSKLDKGAYIADKTTDSLVMFIRGTRKTMRFIDGDPIAFISELSKRCIERFGEYEPVVSLPHPDAGGQAVEGGVFISYANPEDKAAAERLRELLKSSGCDVCWFPGAAQAGDRYDPMIENYILKKTSVFISIVSKTTVSQYGKYFHQERAWARKRALYFRNVPFYLPVVVDADVSYEKVEETEMLQVPKPQIERFPGGAATEEFCRHVCTLQNNFRKQAAYG